MDHDKMTTERSFENQSWLKYENPSLSEQMHNIAANLLPEDCLVVITGCFDFIHPSSLRFMKQARKLGDKLLVAIWDDETTSQLLGYEPINPALSRTGFICAFRSVDFAVSCTRPGFIELIGFLNRFNKLALVFSEHDPVLAWIAESERLNEFTITILPRTDLRSSRDYVPLFRRALS